MCSDTLRWKLGDGRRINLISFGNRTLRTLRLKKNSASNSIYLYHYEILFLHAQIGSEKRACRCNRNCDRMRDRQRAEFESNKRCLLRSSLVNMQADQKEGSKDFYKICAVEKTLENSSKKRRTQLRYTLLSTKEKARTRRHLQWPPSAQPKSPPSCTRSPWHYAAAAANGSEDSRSSRSRARDRHA
jgi:hypothetical protein